MELKLKNGRYVAVGASLDTVSGTEELSQRVMMKLTAKRGSFWPDPEYGSRLHELLRDEGQGNKELSVRQYVSEALADEDDVELESVAISYPQEDTMKLFLKFSWSGGSFSTELIIRS